MFSNIFYIVKFAGRLANVSTHIPYLRDLGVNYVHIMPGLKPCNEASDGGHASQNYRKINPAHGTMVDFQSNPVTGDRGIDGSFATLPDRKRQCKASTRRPSI